MTDQEFRAWAQSSTKHPVLLVEITHKDGTVYLSDQFYATSAGETPEHTSYDVCLKETVLVERTLSEDSLGSIRVYNDGSLDHWLDLLFTGYAIKVFIGDKSWPRTDFKRQFYGTVDSLTQLSSTLFEFTSTINKAVLQTELFNKSNLWLAGNHVNTDAILIGNFYGNKRWRIANVDQFDRDDLSVTYNNNPATITWVDHLTDNTFHVDDNVATAIDNVRFSCPAFEQNLKSLFATICTYIGQAYNADNLAAYPIDPGITFYITQSLTFDEFLTLTLETLGAVLWINDDDEIEFYRKELPTAINDETVFSFITTHDEPSIKVVTTEYPVTAVQVKNSDWDSSILTTPSYIEYNTLDLDYPYRTLITHSYAEDSYAITEARRLADLLAVTRRTYSVTINRITPELFIGAIVNIHSPKDRWEENGQGLNALVVGFTQSFTKNTSELIVWR
jgi:hypothetical protein